MLSRLWYLVLASIAAIGIAAGYLAQATFDSRTIQHVDDQLVRDRTEIELWLRYEARLRVDSIQPLTVRQEVRNALRRASGRRNRAEIDNSLRTNLTQTLNTLNRQLQEGAAQLLFAVDNQGEIIAQLGGQAPPPGAGLGRFPLVSDALRGFVGDDVWLYDGTIYRMAARPVIHGGQYVGAIVHGSVIDSAYANRLASKIPGATLVFHHDGTELGSFRAAVEGAPAGGEVLSGWAAAQQDPDYDDRGRTSSLELEGTDVHAVFSRMVGSAGSVGVGYAVARSAHRLGSPWALFDSVPEEAMGQLPWVLVIGIPLLLAIFGILFLFIEQSRPNKAFAKAVADLAEGKIQRIDEKALVGAFHRRLGANINDGIDKAAARGGGGRKKQDLEKILGDDDGASSSPSFFGMAESSAPEASQDDLFGTPSKPKEKPKAAAPKAPPAPPKAPPKAPPAPPKAPPAPPAEAEDRHTRRTDPPPPGGNAFEEEGNETVVARVPESLIEAASSEEPLDEDAELESHFRSVFEEFVAMKKQCGESTSALTFEKFRATLQKNREAIVAKHGAVGVRFTVYRKNGRAALKATPLKD